MAFLFSPDPDVNIYGLNHTLTIGVTIIIMCMTNIPVSSIEWKNGTSTLANISAANLTVLEYTIDPVKDDLQGQELTCLAVADDGTVYTESQTVNVEGISGVTLCVIVFYRSYLSSTI